MNNLSFSRRSQLSLHIISNIISMKSFTALFVLALVGASTALVDVGRCPDYANMATFDLEAYTGRWYEIERFSDYFEAESTCTTADYLPINETSIGVLNGGSQADGSLISVTGVLSISDVPGELVASFPGDEKVSYYIVLDTDYTSYTCVYFCEEISEYRQQFAWIMSRDPTMDADTLSAATAVFDGNGVEVDLFMDVYQGDNCNYVPEPTPAP